MNYEYEQKALLIRLVVLVSAMMCALGAKAANAYACFTSADSTLSFFYDSYSSSRPGQVFDLVAGDQLPTWGYSSISNQVAHVAFDPSFASARPLSTYKWFDNMPNLRTIQGLNYLNTSEVTNMAWMFSNCKYLTSLDLSKFDTSNVTDMSAMFYGCSRLETIDLSSFNTASLVGSYTMFYGCNHLQTIYAGNGWSTASIAISSNMFFGCFGIVGGQGTTYDENHTDKAYARIDGGSSNPGYFTGKFEFLRGDVNDDGSVSIGDVTALIDYLLSGDGSGVNVAAADCNNDNGVSIGDVTALIDFLLSGTWD